MCRRSLTLTQVDATNLSSLSLNWQPTLLIQQPTLSASTQRLLSAVRYRKIHILRKGRLQGMFCAVATFTDIADVRGHKTSSGIHVPMGPAFREPEHLSDSQEEKIAETLQAKLLGYRLTSHRKVVRSTFDVPQFSLKMRELARSMGRCTPESPELQQKLVHVLSQQDAEINSERRTDLNTILVEVVLAGCHEASQQHLYIGDITRDAMALLEDRGERRHVEAREVGARLRVLGLSTEPRDSKGFRLRLSPLVRVRVHELAYSLVAPTIESGAVSKH